MKKSMQVSLTRRLPTIRRKDELKLHEKFGTENVLYKPGSILANRAENRVAGVSTHSAASWVTCVTRRYTSLEDTLGGASDCRTK